MTQFTFIIKENGQLPDGIKSTLLSLFKEFAGKKVNMIFTEAKDKRSLNQNDYYRGAILPHVRNMMKEVGDLRSLDDWHESLLENFSPVMEVSDIKRTESYLRPKRTHMMSIEEMNQFITAISAECAIRGFPVPLMEV